MSRNTGRKMNKRTRTQNSVQAYACICSCDCACSCGLVHGGAINTWGNRSNAQTTTDSNTKSYN